MAQEYGWKKIISVTEGGKERQDSVFLGLQQVPQDTEIVLIHDGVRPFVTEEILETLRICQARNMQIEGMKDYSGQSLEICNIL